MSRIGNKPIKVPSGVIVTVGPDNLVVVKGPKGEVRERVSREMKVIEEDGEIRIERPSEQSRHRAQHGLARTLIENMVTGVSEGYSKSLEIHGIGYRAQLEGKTLVLNVGFSHPVRVVPEDGVTFEVGQEDRSRVIRIAVKGINKQVVGQVAADIRRIRKPDPYKGKGIRYAGETVKLKQGKRAT